jgi:LPXTG-motif cell wall-anchored protein
MMTPPSAKTVALSFALALGLAAPAAAGETAPAAPLQPMLTVQGEQPVIVGKPVRLDASQSKGDIRGFRFDLDGNGSYETDTGTTPYVDHAFNEPGRVRVRVLVTDTAGDAQGAAQTIEVAAPKPVAVAIKPQVTKAKARTKAAPRARAGASSSVTIKDFSFGPSSITIHPGDTVTWTNSGQAPHDATGSGFKTPTLTPGKSASHTFSQAGTFSYICSIHPFMKGTVVVAGSGGSGGGGGGGSGGSSNSTTPADTSGTAAGAPASTTGQLPNTGLGIPASALTGLLMLGGGLLLRRRLRAS